MFGSFSNEDVQSGNKSTSCSPKDWAVLHKDLGRCGHKASSATFIVGFDRVQAIQYLNRTQTGYYRTKWPTVPEAIEFVLEDYPKKFAQSLAFDADVRSRAEKVSTTFGSKYADIVEASVRQTFGGMELTVSTGRATSIPHIGDSDGDTVIGPSRRPLLLSSKFFLKGNL